MNNNNSKSIYSLNLVCLCFKLNDDIKKLIYEKIKEISVDIIRREWYNYIERVWHDPFDLLLEISSLKLISDSNILETIQKIHLIQKKLNINMIDKEWWQKTISEIKTKIMITNFTHISQINLLLNNLIQ